MLRAPTIKVPFTRGSSFKGYENKLRIRPIFSHPHFFFTLGDDLEELCWVLGFGLIFLLFLVFKILFFRELKSFTYFVTPIWVCPNFLQCVQSEGVLEGATWLGVSFLPFTKTMSLLVGVSIQLMYPNPSFISMGLVFFKNFI